VIADTLRRLYKSEGFEDDFDRESIGSNWNTDDLASASIVDGKLVTEAYANNFYSNVGARYTGSLGLDGDFVIEADLEWVARSGDLARIIVVLFDSSDNSLAFGGMHDAQAAQNPGFHCGITDGDSWFSGYGTRDASGNMVIKLERSGSTLYIYEDGNLRLSGTMTDTVDYIVLTNERKNSYPGKTAKWDYVTISW